MPLLLQDGVDCSVMPLVLGIKGVNRYLGCRMGGLQHTDTLLHNGSHLIQHLRFCRRVEGSNLAVYGRQLLYRSLGLTRSAVAAQIHAPIEGFSALES